MANARAVIDIDINTSPAAAGLRDLQAQINGFTTALNRANTEQGLAAKGITRQLSDLVNASRFFTAETVRMQTSAAQLDNTLKKGQVTMGQFFSARFRKDGLAAAQVMSLANARASALQTQFIQTGAAANGMKEALAIRPLQAFNSATVVSAQKLAIHRAMLQQATTSLINFGKNTQWAGRQLMVGFTVPLTIFAGVAGKAFRDLEKEAVNFRKVYGDAFTPPAEMEANLKAVQELAKEYTKYGIAVKDTVGLAAQAAAAGAQNADLIDATAQSTRLATLGQMEQNQALETTISLQTAFKLSGEELAKSINFLNMVENQTVVTLQDLSAAIPRVAPVIKGLGGSVEDLAVMLAALQEGGVTAEQGANALKSGLASLINPTDRAIDKLSSLGISLNSIVQMNRGDLMGTVQDFAAALQTLDSFTRQQALEEVFGKFQYARLGALFENIVKEGSQAQRVLDLTAMSAQDMAASAERELGQIEQSVGVKFTAAMQKLQLAIAPIGEMFTKMAIPVVNFFVKIIEKFNDLPDFAKNFIGLGTVITGIVIPAGTMFLGLLMNLIGTLVKFGSLVGIAFKGFTSGGFKGAFDAVSQAVKYMSLQEIDASLAAQQLRGSTEAVNIALLEQVGSSEAATAGIVGLAGAYEILVANMREAIALGGLPMAVPGGAMRAAGRRGASNLVGRPLPIVARNKGGSIPYLSDGGRPTVPGVGNKDTVPAMLTPGEFVVNKKATEQNMGLLHAINNGDVQYRGMGGGIAKSGKMYYGVPPLASSMAAQQAMARLAQFESARPTISSIFGLPVTAAGRASRAVASAASRAKLSESELLWNTVKGRRNVRTGQKISGVRSAEFLMRYGLTPKELGLKSHGNFVLAMSQESNMKSAAGTLTKKELLNEISNPVNAYGPLNAQFESYLKTSLDYKAFDAIYRREINNFNKEAISNASFEKITRSALTKYFKEQGFSREVRKSFTRDILKKNLVRANVSKNRIKEIIEANNIQTYDKNGMAISLGSNNDIYVRDLDGSLLNITSLAGRKFTTLGSKPRGIKSYGTIPVAQGLARVHANKGGLIPGVQYLNTAGMVAARKTMQDFMAPRVATQAADVQSTIFARNRHSSPGFLQTLNPGDNPNWVTFAGNYEKGFQGRAPKTVGQAKNLFGPGTYTTRDEVVAASYLKKQSDAQDNQERFLYQTYLDKQTQARKFLNLDEAYDPAANAKLKEVMDKFFVNIKNDFGFDMKTRSGGFRRSADDDITRIGQRRNDLINEITERSIAKTPAGKRIKKIEKEIERLEKIEDKRNLKDFDRWNSSKERQDLFKKIELLRKEAAELDLDSRWKAEMAWQRAVTDSGLWGLQHQGGLRAGKGQHLHEVMIWYKTPETIQYRNNGGFISPTLKANQGNIVPGVGNKDIVPAMLTPGEFVINKQATMDNLGLLHAINSGQMKGYQAGGVVGNVEKIDGKYYVDDGKGGTKGPFRSASAARREAARVTKASQPKMPGMRGMGASMGLAMGGMGVMMLGQQMQAKAAQEGKTSATGDMLATGGIAMSMASILPFMGKFGIALGAIAAIAGPLALSFKGMRQSLDQTANQAMEFGKNLGGVSGTMEEISRATGYQFSGARAGMRMFQFTDQEAQQAGEFSQYFESEQGQAFINELKGTTLEKRYQKVSQMISMAVADGMDPNTAKAYGNAIAFYTNDAMMKMRLAADFKSGRFKEGTQQLVNLLKEREDIVSKEMSKQGEIQSVNYGPGGALAQRLRQTGGNALFGNEALFGTLAGTAGLGIGAFGGAAAGAAFAAGGTAIGASLGSIVPVVGTIIGAALGTLVGIGIGKFINNQEIKKLEENGKIVSATIGSSMEILKDAANAEAAIIEARRNNTIDTAEAERQLAEVRDVEAKAAGRLKEALSLTATGMDVDVSSIESAMKNNLIISGGFGADQAQALIETVSFDQVATKLGYDAQAARTDEDLKEVVLSVMVETLSGITPENMAQKVSNIEEAFASARDQLLAGAENGLTPEEVRGIVTEQSAATAARRAMTAAAGDTGPDIEDSYIEITGGQTSQQRVAELANELTAAEQKYAEAQAKAQYETTQTGLLANTPEAENLRSAQDLLMQQENHLKTIADLHGENLEDLKKTDTVYQNILKDIDYWQSEVDKLAETEAYRSEEVDNAVAAEKKALEELQAAQKAFNDEQAKVPEIKRDGEYWNVVGTDIKIAGENAKEARSSLETLYRMGGESGQLGTGKFINESNLEDQMRVLKDVASSTGTDMSDILSKAMTTSMTPEAIQALMGNDTLIEQLFPGEDIDAVKEELLFLQQMAAKGIAAPEIQTPIDIAADSFGKLVAENEQFLLSIGSSGEEITNAFMGLTNIDIMQGITKGATEFQNFSSMVKELAQFPGIDLQVMLETQGGESPEQVAKNIKTTLEEIGKIDYKKAFGDNWKEIRDASMSLDPQKFINMARGMQNAMGKAFDPKQIQEWYQEALRDVDGLRDKFEKSFDENTGMLKKITVPILTEVFGQELPNGQAIADALNAALPDGFNPMVLPIIAQLSIDPRLAEILKDPNAIASLAKYIQSGGTESQTFERVVGAGTSFASRQTINWGDYVEGNVTGGSPFAGVTTPQDTNGSGQKETTIMEDLKEQLKQIKKLFKGLNKFFTENSKTFRQFIAGPFAPEFLEYLQSQGDKGVKLVQEGGEKLLKAYKKFEKIQITQAALASLTGPLERAFEIARQLGQMNFEGALMGRGLSNERIEYVTDAIGPEKLAAFQTLKAKGRRGRTESEQKEFESLRRDIGAAIRQSEASVVLSQLSEVRSSLNETTTSLKTFQILSSKGIDPIMAQSLMDMGISAEAAAGMTSEQLQELANNVKNLNIAETAKQITTSLKEMSNEIALDSALIGAGYSAELSSELKQVGISLDMMRDKPEVVKAVAAQLTILKAAAESAKDPLIRLAETLDLEISALQAQMEKYERTNIRPLEDALDLMNENIRKKQRDIELEERKKDQYDDNIESLEKEQESLQETYDERVKALDKVANINERIARQQQSQLDIASALSRGDIAGAAAAALQAKQEEARQRIEEARGTITAQYESEREAIDERIKNNRLEIEAIDDRIKTMQMEMRDIQDAAYNKQLEIDAARKEQLKTEERIYKAQLLQNIVQARAAVLEAARTKNVEKVKQAQAALSAMLTTAGGTQEERNQFFSGMAGAEQITSEAAGAAVTDPQVMVAQAFDAVEDLMNQIRSNSSLIVQKLMQSRDMTEEEAQAFFDRIMAEDGGPEKIISALSQAGVSLFDMFSIGGQAEGNVPALLGVIGNSVLASSNYIAGMPTLAEGMYNAFKGMKKILEGKIEEGRGVAASIRAAIDAWNTRPKDDNQGGSKGGNPRTGAFGGYFAFGGMIGYRGSTEPAPGMMYGGKMKKFAYGSIVPGIGMTDRVPALLTPGEFVVRKSVAAEYGPLLTALNSNVFPKMNAGGAMPKSSSNTRDGIQYNYDIDVNVAGTNASPDEIAQAVMYRIKRIDDRQVRGTKLG